MPANPEIHTTIRRHLLAGGGMLVALAAAVTVALGSDAGAGAGAVVLIIATIEAVVIAMVLMHLRHERMLLLGVVALTLVQLIGLLIVPTLGHFDRARF